MDALESNVGNLSIPEDLSTYLYKAVNDVSLGILDTFGAKS